MSARTRTPARANAARTRSAEVTPGAALIPPRPHFASADLPIIVTSYSDCQKHSHQSDMLAAGDKAFAETRVAAPAVLFIDELDSFAQRGTQD